MCGRFTLAVEKETIVSSFKLNTSDFSHSPRYNIAPGQLVPVVGTGAGGRGIALMRWGLIPYWAKEPGTGLKMINARVETIEQKPSFRESFRLRRCLIPADGFYEWKKINGAKHPMRITLIGNPVFAFAGIWDRRVGPGGTPEYTFSILTTVANDFMLDIHDRMPVILTNEREYHTWLNQPDKKLLKPYHGFMEAYRVTSKVNSPQNDCPECINKVLF